MLSSVVIANVFVESLSMNPALLFPWLGYLPFTCQDHDRETESSIGLGFLAAW